MSKINKIQRAIKELDGGAFQKLVDDYLVKKYKFDNIQQLGSHSGSNKVTKGIPDSYIHTKDNSYILVCCSTQNRDTAKKIENDILDCINKGKLCLESERIEKIICAFTSSNITVEQYDVLMTSADDIEVELISIGTLSQELKNVYQDLAYDHLGISLDTHQVLDINSFVDEYDTKGVNSINTDFYYREKELDNVVRAVESSTVTIVSGAPGVGKTRLALEVCRQYEEKGWKILCIRSLGLPLFEDIVRYSEECKKCVFFLDDANDIVILENTVKQIISLDLEEARILITVRDYAKNRIITLLSDIIKISDEKIDPFTPGEIRGILSNCFDIQNHTVLEHIVKLSNGNARLAMLAGSKATNPDLLLITSAEGIYYNYYQPILDQLKLGKNEVILLALIAYIGRSRYKKDSFFSELCVEYLGSRVDEKCLEKLYELELIDWYEREVVRISDQSFANFILFYVICKKEYVALPDIIKLGISNNKKQTVYTIDTILNIFYSDDVFFFVKNSIDDAWDELNEVHQKTLIEAFHQIIPEKALCYLKKYVDETKTQDFDLTTIDFESQRNNHRITKPEIEILARMKNTGYFLEALELFLKLYSKRPDLFMEFYYAIDTFILFDQHSHIDEYSKEQQFLKLLWEKCDNGNAYNYIVLFLRIAHIVFQTDFSYTEIQGNNTITFVTARLMACDQVKQLRRETLKKLCFIYDDSKYKNDVRKVLSELYKATTIDPIYKSIYQSDFEVLYSFFSERGKIGFDESYILSRCEIAFKKSELELDSRFNVLNECFEYTLYRTFSIKNYLSVDGDNWEQRRREQIETLIDNYDVEQYNRIFLACLHFSKLSFVDSWSISASILTLFSILKDKAEFGSYKKILEYYLKCDAPYGWNPDVITIYLLSQLGYRNTFDFINNYSFSSKDIWLASIWKNIDSDKINQDVISDFIVFENNQLESDNPILLTAYEMQPFLESNKQFQQRITNYLLNHKDKIRLFMGSYITQDGINILMSIFQDDEETLQDLYLANTDKYIDYEKNLFWLLYKRDEKRFWKKYIDSLKTSSIEDCEAIVFNRIWNEEKYKTRILYAFEELREKSLFYINKGVAVIFASSKNDMLEERKKDFATKYIEKNCEDIEAVNTLIDAIHAANRKWDLYIILCFIDCNDSIDAFSKIRIFPLLETWTGSEIPLIERKIKFLEELKNKIKGAKYIEHIYFIEEQIRYLRKSKREIIIREYEYDILK